jgi:hypothetical protein
MRDIASMLESDIGSIVVSIILGLGLAGLFKRVCTGNDCVIVYGPDVNLVQSTYYKLDDSCYRYTAHKVPCHK